MSFISTFTRDRDAQNARIRELNRKRKDAVYQFLSSQTFKPEKSLSERIETETIEDYAFRMKLYRWVIGRYELPHLIKEIDRIKAREKTLKHDEVDIDRVILTKALLISDRNRLLRYMLMINKNLEEVRGARNYYRHKADYKKRVKNDLDKLIKQQIFTPEIWL